MNNTLEYLRYLEKDQCIDIKCVHVYVLVQMVFYEYVFVLA